MDRFGSSGKVSKKAGPPFEMDLFSWSNRSEILVEWIAPDKTAQSGPPSAVAPNIPVGTNRNGPFHLISNRNFRNFGLNVAPGL